MSAAVCAAGLLVACGPPASAPPASPDQISAPPTTPAPAAASPEARAAWTSYTTADGDLTFDLPRTWTIKDPAGELPEGGGVFVEVSNEAGKPMATLRTNMATGSTCTERYPYSVLHSQPLAALAQGGETPRFVFETRGDPSAAEPSHTTVAGYGIVTAQEPTGDTACPLFHFFRWPPSAAMFGAFYNPESNATPGDPSAPYLEKAKLYAGTQEFQDILRMITSLRPAG
ncbi:hypothetical protein [Sinomonas mesophila]|uniref:hypothetical protein n=1 Tax=Sinomonas mesophila TaxID=1531955 RepID=UPI000985EF2E|nr:hypothetical protein [Sinomonas mesophila]